MSGLKVGIEGIGAWAPALPDWPAWRALLRGEGEVQADAPARPKPQRLAAGERRRVNLHVLSAIEAADQAVRMSGRDAASLPSVFASMHGDATIMDYMCAVLADTPEHLSPTRFHNSVHNAAVGYWTIATGCHEASNAVAALHTSFGASLLEAATQTLAEDRPVLLVAHDDPASGPLAEVLETAHAFACAFVLTPQAGRYTLDMRLVHEPVLSTEPHQAHARTVARDNPCGAGVTLLEALALDTAADITLAATPSLGLAIHTQPPGIV